DALHAAGAELREENIYRGFVPFNNTGSESNVRAALVAMCRRDDRPTVIFATFDPIAESIYLILHDLGLRVPQDISLISWGGSQRQSAIKRRLTAVTVDEVQTGQQAADLLSRMLHGELPIEYDETISL